MAHNAVSIVRPAVDVLLGLCKAGALSSVRNTAARGIFIKANCNSFFNEKSCILQVRFTEV